METKILVKGTRAGLHLNHNETVVKGTRAGWSNHNETVVKVSR